MEMGVEIINVTRGLWCAPLITPNTQLWSPGYYDRACASDDLLFLRSHCAGRKIPSSSLLWGCGATGATSRVCSVGCCRFGTKQVASCCHARTISSHICSGAD